MDRQTPFSLFIRQALLYPLASPFLPAIANVKKAISYANGKLTGTLEVGLPNPEWQTDQSVYLSFADATTYADYLEADGITVNENPQYLWLVPSLAELVIEIARGILGGGTGATGDFNNSGDYWSRSDYSYPEYYVANLYAPYGGWGLSDVANSNNVRCVKR